VFCTIFAVIPVLPNENWRSWQCQQLAERIKKYVDDLLVWLIDPP
jgi:hypothetical protein